MGRAVGNDEGGHCRLSRKRGGDAKWLSNHGPLCSPAPWWKPPPGRQHTHIHTEHTCMFPPHWMWETQQEKLSHCGQTWPPITLPCGGIMWQRCGQKAAESFFFFCPACKAAKVNNSSNPPHVLQLLIRGTTMDLLQRQHGAAFVLFLMSGLVKITTRT